MKKAAEEKRSIFVITNDKSDTTYGGNRVIATGTVEELERFKKQLDENGHGDAFNIEEMEHTGWNTTIRFSGYNLVEHEGLLYPKLQMDMANTRFRTFKNSLKDTIESLECLSEIVSAEEKTHYAIVIKTIERRIEELNSEKLEVNMLH